MIDLDVLLAPVSESSPCGDDLEYDAQFMALEQAARGKAEQQFGDTVVAAEEPDWGEVIDTATALLLRTKDLRIATYLARGLARTGGPAGLGRGLELLHGLCERYWDQLYPQLDADDGFDPIMRMNALAPLAHPEAGLRELREGPCVRTRGGAISVKQIEYALALVEPPAGQALPSEQEILSAFREAAAADAGFVEGMRRASVQANALQTWLNEKIGSDQAVDLRPLRLILNAVTKMVDQVAAPAEAAADAAGEVPAGEGAGAGSPVRVAVPGEMRSREDVLRMLDKAIEFLERNEPTNPAPLLLRRAQRLMTMNFLEIIEDMTPDGASTVRNLAGIRE
ncbi:type VI secretion system protein TssA [Aquabacterium sp. A7-Y]|uniref:type VI secretion system protein TssA n=1 Tax=Aquabacterium sp. A7-Y TaxID=1349605 RepID=UPI00223D075D|nr:type VI secretion system protein TssA [Aquabacterium sp. A7-Y]MCW7540742.1 type VI secretion system protein TssA [Aquabacterium sp. A7-Y]